MLGGVARRLKRGIDHGMNPGEVFSRVQDHVIAAARAHVERLVLEAFVEKAARAARRRPQGRAQPAVRPARAVRRSRPTGRGSWSTAGSPRSARKAISREVDDLCRKVRPLAGDLVDAFGVPPRCCARRTWSAERSVRRAADAVRTRRRDRGLGLVLPGRGYAPAAPLLDFAEPGTAAARLRRRAGVVGLARAARTTTPAAGCGDQAAAALAAQPDDAPRTVWSSASRSAPARRRARRSRATTRSG